MIRETVPHIEPKDNLFSRANEWLETGNARCFAGARPPPSCVEGDSFFSVRRSLFSVAFRTKGSHFVFPMLFLGWISVRRCAF